MGLAAYKSVHGDRAVVGGTGYFRQVYIDAAASIN